MNELLERAHRAFSTHDSFERDGDDRWRSTTMAFDGRVAVDTTEDGRLRLEVTTRVPVLSAVTVEEVADVVEDGWAETFERRVVDVGGVVRGDHEFDPNVERDGETITVRFTIVDIDGRRAVDDAGALIDFVEGTYVQGVIPGYEYTGSVAELLSAARQQGTGGAF